MCEDILLGITLSSICLILFLKKITSVIGQESGR